MGYVINCNCVLTVVIVKPWAVLINTVMFDFGSKKIHHNMPFQATNDKTFGGREQGYRWALSLAGTHGCPLPPPVIKAWLSKFLPWIVLVLSAVETTEVCHGSKQAVAVRRSTGLCWLDHVVLCM